jgi:ATP-dependent 26S proteasome regulatory subunit
MACKAQAAFAPQTAGIHSYYHGKIEELEAVFREKAQNLRRLEAQRNELNGKVRLLREELQLLQEPGSYVGEVVKAMGKTKVLVKVNPEGKYVVDLDKNIDVTEIKPNLRVALRNDSYVLHKVGPGASAQGVGVRVCGSAQRAVSVLALNSVTSAFVFTYASVNRMCHMCTDTLDAQNEHRFGSVL